MAPMISASENLLFRDIHASVHQGIIGGPIFGFHVTVFLSAAGCFVVACSASEPAQFRYESCCLGCDTTTPMMLGDEENIAVTGSVPDSVSVESTSPSIVSVKATSRSCCPSGIDAASTVCRGGALNGACKSNESATLIVSVDGLAEGSSDLQVKKPDGTVWGAARLSVEKPASLGLACNTKGTVTLAQAGTCPITVRPTDRNGTALMSTGGTIYVESSDPTIVVFGALLQPDRSGIVVNGCSPNGLNDVDMFARSAGDATVTATALSGGAPETLAVHVTM
jgi:hypothetical protein